MRINLPFRDEIPHKYTKFEKDLSPRVEFEDIPEEAESLVLIVEDPDAPGEGAFTHWLVWNIPPSKDHLEEGLPGDRELEEGIKQGNNDFNEVGYGGPKPPRDERHEYVFTAYALSEELSFVGVPEKNELEEEMTGKVLAKAEETSTYKRDFDEPQMEL